MRPNSPDRVGVPAAKRPLYMLLSWTEKSQKWAALADPGSIEPYAAGGGPGNWMRAGGWECDGGAVFLVGLMRSFEGDREPFGGRGVVKSSFYLLWTRTSVTAGWGFPGTGCNQGIKTKILTSALTRPSWPLSPGLYARGELWAIRGYQGQLLDSDDIKEE